MQVQDILKDLGYCCCGKDQGREIIATDCPKHGKTVDNVTQAILTREIDIDDVKRRHSGHWFSAETMRFFNSRVSKVAYLAADNVPLNGGTAYFVSSERYDAKSPRRYTVRAQFKDGSIHTVGEFQAYANNRAAHKDAMALALGKLFINTR